MSAALRRLRLKLRSEGDHECLLDRQSHRVCPAGVPPDGCDELPLALGADLESAVTTDGLVHGPGTEDNACGR